MWHLMWIFEVHKILQVVISDKHDECLLKPSFFLKSEANYFEDQPENGLRQLKHKIFYHAFEA